VAVLRDAETEYLATAYRFMPLAKLWAEKILPTGKAGDPLEIEFPGAGPPVGFAT
jgi:hypothetical protein